MALIESIVESCFCTSVSFLKIIAVIFFKVKTQFTSSTQRLVIYLLFLVHSALDFDIIIGYHSQAFALDLSNCNVSSLTSGWV